MIIRELLPDLKQLWKDRNTVVTRSGASHYYLFPAQ